MRNQDLNNLILGDDTPSYLYKIKSCDVPSNSIYDKI